MALLVAIAIALVGAIAAHAQEPIPLDSYPATPEGFRIDGAEAVRIADRDPNVAAVSAERDERLEIRIEAKPPDKW